MPIKIDLTTNTLTLDKPEKHYTWDTALKLAFLLRESAELLRTIAAARNDQNAIYSIQQENECNQENEPDAHSNGVVKIGFCQDTVDEPKKHDDEQPVAK
jgi:hypothetical protein